jgi:hypothetical protein
MADITFKFEGGANIVHVVTDKQGQVLVMAAGEYVTFKVPDGMENDFVLAFVDRNTFSPVKPETPNQNVLNRGSRKINLKED